MWCIALVRVAVALCMFHSGAAEDDVSRRTQIMEMNEETAHIIFQGNAWARTPILVLFHPSSRPATEAEEAVRAAESGLKEFLVVVSGDQTKMERKLMSTMSFFPWDELPLLAILTFEFHDNNPHADFHTYRYRGVITNETVLQFTQDYLNDKLKQEARLSEPLPDSEGEYDGAVRQLVGLNFDQAIQNKEKDTLVYFYGDGCGLCVKFRAEYKRLAARLQHVRTLDIVWVDASRNDIPQPKRFPTLALFPAQDKPVGNVDFLNGVQLPAVEFSGEVLKGEETVETLVQWLHQEAALEFDDALPALPALALDEDRDQSSMLLFQTQWRGLRGSLIPWADL